MTVTVWRRYGRVAAVALFIESLVFLLAGRYWYFIGLSIAAFVAMLATDPLYRRRTRRRRVEQLEREVKDGC